MFCLQADPYIYPRPSNTWHNFSSPNLRESWSTDEVSFFPPVILFTVYVHVIMVLLTHPLLVWQCLPTLGSLVIPYSIEGIAQSCLVLHAG